MQDKYTGQMINDRYQAQDEIVKGVVLLPLGQITSRPPLYKAVDQGMEVLDRAVKEGRYVVQTS